MLKRLVTIGILLIGACPFFGQATTGYHRINQVLQRAPQGGVDAQVVPYASIYVTSTATGLAATIYSDPLLTAPITNSTVTADQNGNYDYYIPLGQCETETITYPGGGSITNTNVCTLISGTITGQANGVIPLATGVSIIGAQSHLSDNGSTVMSSLPLTVPFLNNTKILTGADPTGVTDSTTAICGALNAMGSNQTLYIPSGQYLIATYTNYQWHDTSNGLRPTACQINGLSNVTIQGLGQVNFIPGGTSAERVLFGLTGSNTNVVFKNLGFNVNNASISEPGTTYLTNENWYPFELEGCTDCQFNQNVFTAARIAIFADTLNGVQNVRLTVNGNRFHSVANYDVLTTNTDGVEVADNFTDHNGRDWNTFGEDIAISTNTKNYNVGPHTSLYPYSTNSRVTPSLTNGPGIIHDLHKYGQGICVEIFSSSQVTATGLDCTDQVAAISSISRSTNTVTVTTSTPVYMGQNPTVLFTGVTDTSFDGTACTSVTQTTSGSTTFTCTQSGANATSSGGYITDAYAPILFTDSGGNVGNAQVSITGSNFYGGGFCVDDYNAGTEAKDGFKFIGNGCYNTQGPQLTSLRSGVIFDSNHFNLHPSGQAISFAGTGSKFVGNDVNNGYLSLTNTFNGGENIITGNYFKGNFTTPIAFLFNFSGILENTVKLNKYEPGTYTSILNQAPAAPVGFHYLDMGLSSLPSTAMPTQITCSVGDMVQSDFTATASGPQGWYCITAGTPGTWSNLQLLPNTTTGSTGTGNVVLSASPVGTGTWTAYH